MMDILLVDDDDALRHTLGRFLTGRGHCVVMASEGDMALHLMQTSPPDLLLCDIQMPGMDGITLLQTVRQQFPNLPVILMTGARDIDFAIKALRGGATDFLKKPVQLQELQACLEKIGESTSC
ncbi:MAG: response regulator [Candidatus Latescibacteria bacterium]|nr:response regulator [Candidatus Latescibacterota bacterium]